MIPQTICQQFWNNVIKKIQIERDPISIENYLGYETKIAEHLVINDHRYGAVYAVDNLYCAYKSVIQLLNKKDPKIHDFKTGLYNMHDREGLITLKDFENFRDSYGIKEALPIYSKEEFDKGFNNHKMFMRDCIIMIHGSSVDQSYMHMLAYKAAGKKYVKLMEMEYQAVEDDNTNVQTVPNKVEVKAEQPKYTRKTKAPLFSGTRQDFYHMLRLACNLYSERFQNGLLTESFEPSSVYILGQLALHKSYIYQHIDFSQDFSQIVYSTICVMLNRKSDLVLMMPPKTINLPTRYVSNVTKGEKSKNSKTFLNDLKVGVWRTKKQKQSVKQKKQQQQLQDNKDKKQQKLLMKQQVDQAAELHMFQEIAKSNMKMIHDKIVDDYMNQDQSQNFDLCLSYDHMQQDQNADLSFNIYTNNSSSISDELQCFGEPMTPFDIRTHELLTEQQAILKQQANSQDIMLLCSQLPLDQVNIAKMDQAYLSAQSQDKYTNRWVKFTNNVLISSSSQFKEEQLLPISDDEDEAQQQDNVSQQDFKIDTYEDSNTKTALIGALNICESNKSVILKSSSLTNLWFLTVIIARFVACQDAFFVLIENIIQILMHVVLSSIEITYEYVKLQYYIYKSYFIDSWSWFKRIFRDSTLTMPVVDISQPALLGVQPASLAQIYSHYVTPVQLLNKDKIHHWQYVDGYGMVANPQPGVTKQCTQAIQKAGLYVHSKSINNNTTTGGGHSCIRYCSDSMFSKSLQYISQAQEPIVIIDVGAKYGSMLTILNQIYIKKDIKPGHFCGYLPVRPNDVDYDQAYHEQNFKRYNSYVFGKETKQKDGKNTIFNLQVQQKYIQDVDWELVQLQIKELFGFIDNVKYYVIMNDCHYYFDNTFSLPFKHTLLLSGMNYIGYTGTYLLPFSDGYFQIDANQETKRGQITMMPQSTTKKYTHPYTFIDKTDCEIDFGWISFIQKVQVMLPNQKYDIQTPNVIDVGCNVQQHYFYQYYSKLPSNYDTIKQQQARWEKQQFKDTVEVQYNSQEAILYQCNNKSIFERIILYIYHSWIMRFIFGEIEYIYDQNAYIHLPKAGLTKIPTRTKPNAVLHDQVDYCDRSKKTMIGTYKADQMKADQIKLGYISPQTFKDINYALGLQPQDLDYNILPHVTRPKETKYTKISANKQQNYTTCYVTKDFPDTVILNASQINPLIKVSGQDDQYNYNYQQCIKQYHNAEIIKQTTLVLPTGIRHLRMTQEEQLATVEFATTSIHNQIFALYGRCFKSQQQFSLMHLQSYKSMVQRFLTWFEIQLNKLSAEYFDPIQWVDQKDDFPFDKKQKYQRTILQQLQGNLKDFQFSYKSMLKSGEEFLISMEDLDLPRVVVDKKPRDIKVPAPQGCGIFTAIQSEFWEPIKKILPGFIQGYLPQDLKDLFKNNIDKYDSVISDDGSSFEATQFYDLQQIVDKPVMLILLKWFKQMNMNNSIFQDLWINMPLDKLVDVLCPDKNLVFVKMPNDGEVWDDVTIRWWNRDWKQAHGPAEDNYDKYLPYWIRGTTFSGVPQTTLMNTFRKLTYSYYDIYVATGIDAWVSEEFFVAAAGDDGITMGNNLDNQLTKIQQVKLDLSNPDTKIRGLGQCITEAPITESWNFDFCSKLILRDHGVFMGRDLLKILTQKQYYTKKNQVFQVYPQLHVQAILDGLIPERSSRLLEDILRVRLEKVTVNEHTDYKLPEKKHYHSLTTDTGYEFEDIINQYLNIDLSDLIMHIESGQAIDPRPLKTHSVDNHQDMKLGYFEPYKTTNNTIIEKITATTTIEDTIMTNNNRREKKNKNQNKTKQQNKIVQSNNDTRPKTQHQVNNHKKKQGKTKNSKVTYTSQKTRSQQMLVRHNSGADYVKSILNPFGTDPVRGPSDFHLPTSMINHRYELDHIFGTTHGCACLLPQHMAGQNAANHPSWFNVKAVHSTQTQPAYLGGDGILTGECPLAGYGSFSPSQGGQTSTLARFTSARLLRVGIKIYPTANVTVKSGTMVIAQVPGKTSDNGRAEILIPTVQQLKQYPTSVTVQLSTVDSSGQSYIWLPLDVDDTIFQSPALVKHNQDNQAAMQQFRNPIWILFEGISAQDSYRFEIYSSYEYVPTMVFEPWANVSVTKTPNSAYSQLKQILNNDLFSAVAGIVGEELTNSKYATGMLKPAINTFMALL